MHIRSINYICRCADLLYYFSIMDQFSKLPFVGLSPTDKLSERQKQCLELVAAGYTSKEIARQLNLSPSTVDNHLNAALERLGVDSRTTAARMFVQHDQWIGHDGSSFDQYGAGQQFTDVARERPLAGEPKRDTLASALFSIPALGGRENKLSQRRRYYHVVQIMILGLMTFSAVTVTIAGIVHLFSR
jgi:DNA-binding CsgD family transcriptional regulator